MIAGSILLEHIHDPLAAAHINPMAFGIDEDVIGIAAGFDFGGDMPVLGGERHQGGRAAKYDHNPPRLAVQRHRKIRSHTPSVGKDRPDPESRSAISMPRASGTLTKTCLPGSSIWKPSGCAFSGISAVLLRLAG